MNNMSKDPRRKEVRCNHILEVTLSRNIKNAVRKTNV